MRKLKYLLLVLLLTPIWVNSRSANHGAALFGQNWYGWIEPDNENIITRSDELRNKRWEKNGTVYRWARSECNNYRQIQKNTRGVVIFSDTDNQEFNIELYEDGTIAYPVEAMFVLNNKITHFYPIVKGYRSNQCPTLVVLGQETSPSTNLYYGGATVWLKYPTTKDTVVISELNKSQNINDDKIAIFCQINPDTGTCKFLDVEDVPTQHSTKKEIKCPENDDENNYIKACACLPAGVADITSRLYMLLKIAAPAILIIVGGFDMIKAMSAQDEKGIKSAQTKLIRKFVVAAAIFLLFSLAQWIVSLLATNEANAENILNCLNNLLNGYNI